MQKRIDWIDNLKGIGIILVVWAHMGMPEAGEHIIYSFHMPLFFMISGFLYKKRTVDFNFIKYKFTGLMIPYFIFSIPSLIIGIIMGKSLSGEISNFFFVDGHVGWNSPLWFLVILFFVSILYPVINKYLSENIIGLSVFVIGLFVSNTDTNFLGYEKIIFGLLFYFLGSLLAKIYAEKEKYTKYETMILVLSIALNLVFGYFLNPRISFYWNTVYNYFYFVIAAFFGSIAMFIIVSKIKKMPKLIKFYGVNSIVIIGAHYFFKYLFIVLGNKLGIGIFLNNPSLINSMIKSLIILIGILPIIWLYNKTMNLIFK